MWLHVPKSPASPSAPASACSTKDCAPDSITLASTIARSVTWKGKLMPLVFWRRACKRASWTARLSGLTSSPSTLQHGADAFISSLPVFPVSHTASPASAKDSATSVGYGPTLPALLATFDPTTCGWKTSQGSLLPEDSTPASPVSPRSGSMRSGMIFLRPKSVLRTSASDCSSWPTPSAAEAGSVEATTKNGDPMSPSERAYNRDGVLVQRTLNRIVEKWKTPHGMSGTDSQGKLGGGGEFAKQVHNWATPRATDGTKGGPNCRGSRGDPILAGQVFQWSTPDASAYKYRLQGNSQQSTSLEPITRRFCSLQVLSQNDGQALSPTTRILRLRLNPAFACWLMGWPGWWTSIAPISFAPSAMASYRSRLQRHLSSLLDGQA